MSTSSSPASEAGSTLVVKKGHTTATCETPSATRSDSPKSETSDISSDKSKKVKLEPEVVETIDSVATTDCATSESSTKERELNAPVLAIDDKLEICSTIPVIEFSSPIATSSYDTSPQALCTSDVVVSQDEDKSMCANLSKLISANNQQPSLANILVTSNKVPSSSANKIFLTDHTLIKTSNFPNGCSTTTSAITTSSTSTKPLVINHLSSLTNVDKVVKHPSETQSIIPTLSSQLIFSSIITTKPAPSQNPATQISRTLTVPAKTSNPSSAKTTATATLVVANGKNSATTTQTSHGSRGNKSSHNKQNGTNLTMSNTNVSNVGQVAAARLIDMGKRLLDAARDGHTDHVRQLVVNSGAPFTSDWLGTTALHLAAQFGHTEIADILLKGGVNRDAKTKLDRTALHLASQNGWLGVVDLLLIHGSDVNARDMLKMTPLHWAVQRCHASVVERLLLSGADVSAKSKFDLTPIDLAQTSDCYEIIELFKSWTNCSDITFDNHHHQPVAVDKSGDLSTLNYNFNESHDMLDVDYHLTLDVDHHHTAAPGRTHTLDIDEPGIDLELEWNTLKFEPDFFLTNNDDDEGDEGEDDDDDGEPKVEYLKKIVEELTKENRQLRQRVEQLSTTSKCQ